MNYLALSGHWHSPYELIRAAAKLLQEMPFFAALLEIEASQKQETRVFDPHFSHLFQL